VRARRVDGGVEVEVDDDGRGIEADDLPHIFDRFYRGGQGRAGSGAGLGLAIARRIVELHGGTLRVASAAQRGTQFSFGLPA
jgi:signal transduction histidine kinase